MFGASKILMEIVMEKINTFDVESSDSSNSSDIIETPLTVTEPGNDLEQIIAMSLIDKEQETNNENQPSSGFGFKIQEVKSLAFEAAQPETCNEPTLPPPPPLKPFPTPNVPTALKVRSLTDLIETPPPPKLKRKRLSNMEVKPAEESSTNLTTTENAKSTAPTNKVVQNEHKSRRKSQITTRVLDDEDELFANSTLNQNIIVPPPQNETDSDLNLLRTVAFLRVSVNHILEKIGRKPITFDRKRPTLASLVYKYSKSQNVE